MPSDAYPNNDFPWTLYFNGHPMPRWANCWSLVPILDRVERLTQRWDEEVDFRRFWRLHCRIDHVGVVESEDPHAFRACCLAAIVALVRDQSDILREMDSEGNESGAAALEIFSGVRDGLFGMYHHCHVDGFAFWTSGYESDRESLLDAVRRHGLPTDHPDWMEAPHLRSYRSETIHRIQSLRKEVISIISQKGTPAGLRKLVMELPKDRIK